MTRANKLSYDENGDSTVIKMTVELANLYGKMKTSDAHTLFQEKYELSHTALENYITRANTLLKERWTDIGLKYKLQEILNDIIFGPNTRVPERIKAIALLAKMCGLLVDRTEIVDNRPPLTIDYLVKDEDFLTQSEGLIANVA